MVSTCTSFLRSILGVDSLRISILSRHRARVVAFCLVLVSMACGGWSAATAQTAHFGAAQSTIGSGLNSPGGIGVDANGNVYVSNWSTGTVYKETLSAGGYSQSAVNTSSLSSDFGVAVDGNGNVYITTQYTNQVLKETPSASGYTQTVVANAAANGLSYPEAVAVDGNGNVYIADGGNNRVLKETLTGSSYTQTIIADAATNGIGISFGVAVDGSGNVYISDTNNNRVLKETLSAGSYTQTVVANGASNGLDQQQGIAVDGSGNVYIADTHNTRVLKETPSPAGYTQSLVPSSGLTYPTAVAVDASGNVYITSSNEEGDVPQVLKETLSGGNFGSVNVGSASPAPISIIFTFDSAGTLGSTAVLTQGVKGLDFANAGTGTCKAGTAYTAGETCTVDVSFTPKFPGTRYGAAELLDGSGNVLATGFVQGTGVGPQASFLPGVVSTIASGFTNDHFEFEVSVTVDGGGNVFVADNDGTVYKETPTAGGYTQTTLLRSLAPNGFLQSIAIDGSGSLYLGVLCTADKETLDTGTYTQSQFGSVCDDSGIAVDSSGDVYIAGGPFGVYVEKPVNGQYTQTAFGTGFVYPTGVAADGLGNIYIADNFSTLYKETPSNGAYTRTTVVTGLLGPTGIAVDGGGNLYALLGGSEPGVYKLTPSGSGYIQTPIGTSRTWSQLSTIAVDGAGNVYVADSGSIYKIDLADPPVLHFAATEVGHTSSDSPQKVMLTNTGNTALSITSVTEAGADASSFVFANNCGTSLAANASCAIHGHFAPSATGPLTAAITIKDNASNSPQIIKLSGTGLALPPTLSASSLSFGAVKAGTVSASQSVTLTNTGSEALSIAGIAVTGADAASFAFVNNCGTSLAAKASCSIHGHFAPKTGGVLAAAITITDNASGSPQSIKLSGTGEEAIASLSAASLSFGTQKVGTASASQSVTLSNTGNEALSLTVIAVTGADASSFAFSNNCGTSLAAGAKCTIHGHFAPAASGALTADLTIKDNASGSPQSVALSGTGQ